MGAIGLHIGLPKTGSSAIQAFLRANAPALEQFGVGYSLNAHTISDVAGVPNGNGRALLKYLDPRRRDKHFDAIAFEQGDFLDLYMPDPNLFCLISSELLASIDWRQLPRFKQQIVGGHSLTIIAMVRNIYDHAVSTWNQRVKWHAYSKPFEYYALNEYDNPQARSVRKYSDCFGWQNIRLINYGHAKHDLIGEFFRAIGVAAPPEWQARRVNRGLTQAELAVQMALNSVHHDARCSKVIAQRMVALRPQATAAKLARPEVSQLLSERFRPEIDRLALASGVDLAWMLDRPGMADEDSLVVI